MQIYCFFGYICFSWHDFSTMLRFPVRWGVLKAPIGGAYSMTSFCVEEPWGVERVRR